MALLNDDEQKFIEIWNISRDRAVRKGVKMWQRLVKNGMDPLEARIRVHEKMKKWMAKDLNDMNLFGNIVR